MIKEVIHIGLTVSNIEKSIEFYRDILGLNYKGQMLMEGKETDLLFGIKNCKAKVAYLNGSDNIFSPPIELIEFISPAIKKEKRTLFETSISEICFKVDNIEKTYKNLKLKGVEFLSEPQFFDSTKYNLGKSKAVYFKDIDGIILELLEIIE